MQTTPKARAGWSEKKSPAATPRSARRLKTPQRQSPKALPEKRISELEGELRKAKEELSWSEALKREAEAVAEERKQQLMEMSASEDSRIDELRKLSQERDKVWQSELEAMQRQHAMDSAALASAMNDLQKLKAQLSESDSAPQTLVENLARYEISQLRTAVEVAEARYHEEYIESTLQIRSAFEQVEVVKSEYSQREVKMEEELKSSMAESEALRERLMEKEMEVQSIKSQNETLRREMETKAAMDEATSTQLERLKVQCEQWRKAAEAAASMLSDGKSVESPLTRNVYLDDTDEELSPKKKNGNMLRKIGVLLKKGQK